MGGRVLKPLSFAGLLDETFDLYKRNFATFLGIAALLSLPYLVTRIFGGKGWQNQILWISVTILSFISGAAATWATSEIYLGAKASIIGSYRVVLKRAWPLLGTMLLEGALIVLGLMLCVIPGIVLLFWYSFVSQVCILEGKAWRAALGRSKELARGQIGRIFVLYVLMSVLDAAIYWGYSVAMTWATGGDINMRSRGMDGLYYGLGLGALNALVAPLRLISFILLYYDIRVRNEGFDIKWLARNVAASSPRPKAAEKAEPA